MFNNTDVAFAYRTDKEIRNAGFLFSVIRFPWLVKASSVLLNIALFIHFPVKWLLKPTIFKHFCGGETIAECDKTIATLGQYNVKTILDYSAEGSDNEKSYDHTTEEILKIIDSAKSNPDIPFSVFKPTGIARFGLLEHMAKKGSLTHDEEEEFKKVKQRFDKICGYASQQDIPVMVDAEETWIQGPVDELVYEMMLKYNHQKAVVFNTLQLYRKDRLDYLNKLTEAGRKNNIFIGLKLVRGAYIEKERERAAKLDYPTPVYGSKPETDAAYNNAVEHCFINSDIITVCNATHNELSCALLTELINKNKLAHNDPHYWFAQLYGMSDHISFNLSKEGYNVCKYLPYGPVKSVTPYLIRRAEENTSVAGQTGRELQLIKKELNRRKLLRKKS